MLFLAETKRAFFLPRSFEVALALRRESDGMGRGASIPIQLYVIVSHSLYDIQGQCVAYG